MTIQYYKLFDLMRRRGIKTKDLLALTGITDPTAAKIRKGKNINTDTIDKICKALSVQPGEIMEYIPEPTAEDQEEN